MALRRRPRRGVAPRSTDMAVLWAVVGEADRAAAQPAQGQSLRSGRRDLAVVLDEGDELVDYVRELEVPGGVDGRYAFLT